MKKWLQDELYWLDFTFDVVEKEYGTPEISIYGGVFDRFLLTTHFYRFNIYVSNGHLIYSKGGRIYEIPLDNFIKLKIKEHSNRFDIKFKTDKKYHIVIYNDDWIFTEKTGYSKDNCEKFVKFLKSKKISVFVSVLFREVNPKSLMRKHWGFYLLPFHYSLFTNFRIRDF